MLPKEIKQLMNAYGLFYSGDHDANGYLEYSSNNGHFFYVSFPEDRWYTLSGYFGSFNSKSLEMALAEETSWRPINDFVKHDIDENDVYLLRTKDGVVYLGQWDPESGYFFAHEVINNPKDATILSELPGRMYDQPVAFK